MVYPLVVFDLETGGFEWWPVTLVSGRVIPMRPIIQIAAMSIDRETGERIGSPFEIKVAFKRDSATEDALAVNHYSEEVWAEYGINPLVALQLFVDWLVPHKVHERIGKSGRPYRVAEFCGHNSAGFDMNFITAWFKHFGKFLPADFNSFDTVQLAQVFQVVTCHQFKNLKLGTIAEELGVFVEGDTHDALTDVRTTAGIYHAMISDLQTYYRVGIEAR